MKRITGIVCGLLLAALALGCAPSAASGQDGGAHGGTGLVNPMREVSGADAFAPLDLYIEAPAESTDVSYHIIGGSLAQVSFTLDGHAYTYRAAHTQDDITGLYVEYEDEEAGVEADGENWYASIRIRTVKNGGGMLAEFAYGTARFSLYTADTVEQDALSSLAVSLAAVQCPYYAD